MKIVTSIAPCLRTTILLLLLVPVWAKAQRVTISGTVVDEKTREQLIQASVLDVNSGKGTVTNYYGFYSLTLTNTTATAKLLISYVGYLPVEIVVPLTKDTVLNIGLTPYFSLTEVVISSNSPLQTVDNTQMSALSPSIEKVKMLPTLFGEVDILKTLQLMPGVSGGTEGTSGIFVRGGGTDQNMFLLDGVPIYNVSHVLGLFSVFNADAIRNVDLLKGGFPARYGGRLSSIVDIRLKEGNMVDYHGNVSVGLISSKFMLEGPIVKNKASFIISARRTYVDMFMLPFIAQNNVSNPNNNIGIDLYFYDLNAKLNYRFSDKDRLYLSVYSGRDIFGVDYTSKNKYGETIETEGGPIQREYNYENSLGFKFWWGNVTTSLRWNHVFSPKLFSNTTLTFTDYKFETGMKFTDKRELPEGGEEKNEIGLTYFSNIRDFGAKIDFDYIPSTNHYVRFGVNATQHYYTPGAAVIQFKSSSIESGLDTTLGNVQMPAMEYVLYAEDDWNISNRFKANVGVHASAFANGETFYYSVQPRASLRYKAARNVSVKASFVTMTQYINLLTNSFGNLPTDLWVPSTKKVKPQDAWQVALGGAWAINNQYEFTSEVYYKKMRNLVEYREGESFLMIETDWESKVTQGDGEAYGLELFLNRSMGDFTGWIGYTLSWSNRTFAQLNKGETFPFKYDRRHDLSLVGSYKLNKHWDFNGVFVLYTGNAYTLYDQKIPRLISEEMGIYYNNENGLPTINTFETRNSYRMDLYHRLDLSANYTFKGKKYTHIISAGGYNMYFKKNPTFVYPYEEYNYNLSRTEFGVRKFSLLPFMLPYLSYTFKF
jgi:hypothetical protein